MRIISNIRKYSGSRRGSTSIVIVCTIIIVVLFSALLSDIGYEAIMRIKLNYDTESIAKAGAEEFAKDEKVNLEWFIYKYSVKRIHDFENLNIKVSGNEKEITVKIDKPFSYIFLKFIGIDGKKLESTAVAEVPNKELIASKND